MSVLASRAKFSHRSLNPLARKLFSLFASDSRHEAVALEDPAVHRRGRAAVVEGAHKTVVQGDYAKLKAKKTVSRSRLVEGRPPAPGRQLWIQKDEEAGCMT